MPNIGAGALKRCVRSLTGMSSLDRAKKAMLQIAEEYDRLAVRAAERMNGK
jgi:hypothetical protein